MLPSERGELRKGQSGDGLVPIVRGVVRGVVLSVWRGRFHHAPGQVRWFFSMFCFFGLSTFGKCAGFLYTDYLPDWNEHRIVARGSYAKPHYTLYLEIVHNHF